MFTAIKNGFLPTLKTFGNAAVIGAGAAFGVGVLRSSAEYVGKKLTQVSENTKVKMAEKKAGKVAQEVAKPATV